MYKITPCSQGTNTIPCTRRAVVISCNHIYFSDITSLKSIGHSVMGRDLWVLILSDNPDVHELGMIKCLLFDYNKRTAALNYSWLRSSWLPIQSMRLHVVETHSLVSLRVVKNWFYLSNPGFVGFLFSILACVIVLRIFHRSETLWNIYSIFSL